MKRSDYLTILDNWLSEFPREQLYIGFFEDIVHRPRKLLSDIFSHIGVSPEVEWTSFPVDRIRSPGLRVKGYQGSPHYMPPEIRRFLEEMYAEKIERLHERFGEPVAGWRREGSGGPGG